jgi:integrase
MALKKKTFKDDEISIFDDAVIYKRNDYWHFRLWLPKEKKYARKSLQTRNKAAAIEKGKKAYLELQANIQAGKTYFSLTTKDGVELYLKSREKDVETRLIVPGRFRTIKTHLEHWLDFIGRDEKLKELDRQSSTDYYHFRSQDTSCAASPTTVLNEQSTINACIKFLFKNNEVDFDAFEFKKLPRYEIDNEAIKRSTFSNEEWRNVLKTMRDYRRESRCDDPEELLERRVVRYWIMIAANSGLRIGEQRQLRWSDVTIETKRIDSKTHNLARINVRAATSKVRKSRTFYCRGGYHFERLKRLTKPEAKNALVFSLDGETIINEKVLLKHFNKILELAKIENMVEREIVPYSLRHFMITQRIMAGANPKEVADMCGTSMAQIEKTYYHLDDATRLTTATADFKITADGTIQRM